MKQANRTLRARVGAALVALLVAVTALGAAAAETFALVSGTDSLNLRATASSSSQWLGAYPRGSWVTLTGSQNNFYLVNTSDGKTGYMSKNFLRTTDQLTFGNVAVVRNQKETAFLNLRAYPSYSASVITILYNGVPLNVLGSENGWYRVQLGGTETGYVRSEYTTTSFQPMVATVATIKTPNNSAVNLRARPVGNAPVIRQFPGDRYVAVYYQGTGWWYVGIDGYTGFISSDFLVEGLHAARDEAAQGGDGDAYATVKNPVSTQRLNLRTQPSTASQVVTKLTNGTRLSVIAQGTEWCEVFVDSLGVTGYVMTQYLKLVNLPKTPKVTVVHPQGSFVNLRASASMTASVITRIPSGKQATVVAPGADWMQVKYGKLTGYVMNYFTSANP